MYDGGFTPGDIPGLGVAGDPRLGMPGDPLDPAMEDTNDDTDLMGDLTWLGTADLVALRTDDMIDLELGFGIDGLLSFMETLEMEPMFATDPILDTSTLLALDICRVMLSACFLGYAETLSFRLDGFD